MFDGLQNPLYLIFNNFIPSKGLTWLITIKKKLCGLVPVQSELTDLDHKDWFRVETMSILYKESLGPKLFFILSEILGSIELWSLFISIRKEIYRGHARHIFCCVYDISLF